MAAAVDCGDELFGEEEFVDQAGGAVDLGELAFFFIGSRGHGDDVADATEESDFDGERIVADEVIEVKIEKQDVGCVFHGEMQRVFEVSRNADDVRRMLGLQQGGDEAAEGSTVVGDQNAD